MVINFINQVAFLTILRSVSFVGKVDYVLQLQDFIRRPPPFVFPAFFLSARLRPYAPELLTFLTQAHAAAWPWVLDWGQSLF